MSGKKGDMRQIILSVFLCVSMVFVSSACSSRDGNNVRETQQTDTLTETSDASGVPGATDEEDASTWGDEKTGLFLSTTVGDTVFFGSYEQDNDEANGKESIEWDVLDAQSDRVLLVSHYVLDCIPYNVGYLDSSWEACTLREWLNDTFYNTAFSEEEQGYILKVPVSNRDDARSGETGGNDTNDRVFLLSVGDARTYYTFNSWYDYSESGFSEQLITAATPYALGKGVESRKITGNDYLKDETGSNWQEFIRTVGGVWGGLIKENYSRECIGHTGCAWWMRSVSPDSGTASVVYNDGRAGWYFISPVDWDTIGVRPVLWASRTNSPETQNADAPENNSESHTEENEMVSLYEEVLQKNAEIDSWFETEATDMMSMRMKTGEQYELWDSFLNTLLAYFEATLPEEEWNSLNAEQQAWSDEADSIAEEYASQYEGGTAYPLELSSAYTREMMARAEELMQRLTR